MTKQRPVTRRATASKHVTKHSPRWPTILAVAVLTLAVAAAVWWVVAPMDELQGLVGRWQRSDGGYVIEIKAVADSGEMEAAYFNPRPIHVGAARASKRDGVTQVFVELRDVNYPGSIYRLAYDPVEDRLSGTYFQAVTQETFRVGFSRLKP